MNIFNINCVEKIITFLKNIEFTAYRIDIDPNRNDEFLLIIHFDLNLYEMKEAGISDIFSTPPPSPRLFQARENFKKANEKPTR